MCRIKNISTSSAYKKYFVVLAAFSCGLTTRSQELSLSFASEWQTDFQNKFNWINMLQSESSINICHGLSGHVGTISTSSTNEGHLFDDLLTYSNIEEENIPLALSRFGIGLVSGKWSGFVGVGNVNDAFFVTPVTSLFTNSSCGIFPTISCNFCIANFPDASVGVEGRYENDNISINSAIYNGQGYHGFSGNDCVFRFRPLSDGIFNINAVNYRKYDNNYNMGIGIYHGHMDSNENGTQKILSAEISETKKTEFFYWLYAEQKIIMNMSLIAQYSQCPDIEYGCRNFYGMGLVYNAKRYDIGLYSCYADFTDNYEWGSELTLKYKLSPGIDLQSSLHYIKNTTADGLIGLIRMCVTL